MENINTIIINAYGGPASGKTTSAWEIASELKKLGYIKTQYEFSEQFLGKNKYYFGMILSEQRHPSLDAIYHLITGISQINDGLNKLKHLDNLYEEGQGLITKRLLKYF